MEASEGSWSQSDDFDFDLEQFGDLSQWSDKSFDSQSQGDDNAHASPETSTCGAPHSQPSSEINQQQRPPQCQRDEPPTNKGNGTASVKACSDEATLRAQKLASDKKQASTSAANNYSHLVVFTAHKAGMNSSQSKVKSEHVNKVGVFFEKYVLQFHPR